MRETKFRIWDKEKKNWLSPDSITIANQVEKYGHWVTAVLAIRPEFELMQFTGLKDKNGKEIFEGDIIFGGMYKVHVADPLVKGGYLPIEKKIIEQVEWDDRTGFCPFIQMKDDGLNPQECEVLGNIYENPELVK